MSLNSAKPTCVKWFCYDWQNIASLQTQDKLCLPHHILEERGLVKVGVTVQALLDLSSSSRPAQLSTVWHELERCGLFAVIKVTPLPSPRPIARDQRAARGEDLVDLWESASAWLNQETERVKYLCLLIWCQLPPTPCPSHFHLYPVASYSGHPVYCMCGLAMTVCFPSCTICTWWGETEQTMGL